MYVCIDVCVYVPTYTYPEVNGRAFVFGSFEGRIRKNGPQRHTLLCNLFSARRTSDEGLLGPPGVLDEG